LPAVAIYALGGVVPRIDPEAYVHPEATVIGDVTLGPLTTVWPQAVLRGDGAAVVVGARTSVQDGAVIHCAPGLPTVVGDDCTIGHLAHLEGCVVGNLALIGTGSIVLHAAVIEDGSLVGAGAVVPGGMTVPTGAVAVGVPARLRLDAVDLDELRSNAQTYVDRGLRYRAELRRVDAYPLTPTP
jgi:carbonic anhydrase/acetyltransferase-like protein (isoleucine patch superfamily)